MANSESCKRIGDAKVIQKGKINKEAAIAYLKKQVAKQKGNAIIVFSDIKEPILGSIESLVKRF